MTRKLILGIVAVLVVLGGLAAVKTMQIKTMMAAPMPQQIETIATAVALQEHWQDTLSAVGSVSAAQGVIVAPEIAGTVSEIKFESGTAVKEGDLLLCLDTSSEKAQLRAAEAQVEWATVSAERLRKLREDKTVSQSELDQAEASLKQAVANADNIRATIQKKTIRAPFAGKLGIRLVNLGEQLNTGSGIVSLQSLAPIYVDFSLPQQDFAQLQTGLKVRAISDAYPSNVFEGEISAINPDLDSVTRSVRVRAKFANQNEMLRAGMFARVTVVLPDERPVLVIPETALLRAPYGDSVFIVTQDTKSTNLVVQQAFIRTGRAQGNFVSVESGLKAGDKVATAGAFKLRNGVNVQENNQLAPQPSMNPNPPNS